MTGGNVHVDLRLNIYSEKNAHHQIAETLLTWFKLKIKTAVDITKNFFN